MLRSVYVSTVRGSDFAEKGVTNFASQLGLTQALVEANLVIAMDQSKAQFRWNQILRAAFHTFFNVTTINDHLNVLSYGRVGS